VTISYRYGLLGDVLDSRRRAAEAHIGELSSADLAARSHEDIVEDDMRSILFDPLDFDFENSYFPTDPVQGEFEVLHPLGEPNPWGRSRRVVGATYTIKIPFTGSRELIELVPHGGSGHSHGAPLENAFIGASTVDVTIPTTRINPKDAESAVRQAVDRAKSWLEQQASWSNVFMTGWLVKRVRPC
jgi:hypothetical protein